MRFVTMALVVMVGAVGCGVEEAVEETATISVDQGSKEDGTLGGSICLRTGSTAAGRFRLDLTTAKSSCPSAVRLRAWVDSGDMAVITGVNFGNNDSGYNIKRLGTGRDLRGATLSGSWLMGAWDGGAQEGSYLVSWASRGRIFRYGCGGGGAPREAAIAPSQIEVTFDREDLRSDSRLCVKLEAETFSCADAILGRERDPMRLKACEEAKGEYIGTEESLNQECNSTKDIQSMCIACD